MTIAKRLLLLLAVPLVTILALAVLVQMQLHDMETRMRFVTGQKIPSLTVIGDCARIFGDMRVEVRTYVLSPDKARQAEAMAKFQSAEAKLNELFARYADTMIADDRDRRLLDDYRNFIREWLVGSKKAMSVAADGQHDDAQARVGGFLFDLAERINAVSSEWGQYNNDLATNAGKEIYAAMADLRAKRLATNAVALFLMGALGYATYRRIALPMRALESSVKAIASGDYAQEIPFTQARDETGSLARSISVLKEGAAAMEEQRWVNANVAKLTGDLQGVPSLAEFGQRLISGLVPLLGGGVAGFYLLEPELARLRRLATYGLAEGASVDETFGLGENLVGQCARDRQALTLAALPPDYLRVSSGLGSAVPVRVLALPLLFQETVLGVIEFAALRPGAPREQTLLNELLPVVAMSLEILQRNLRTQALLAQTQAQANTLEAQTRQLSQSQQELLAQQAELTAQREQLKAAEARSRLILESSSEGIFGTDADGCVTFVNAAACRMLGYTADELLGEPSHAKFHHHRPDGSHYPKEECPMFAAYKHGRASRIDDECLWRKDGTGVPVEYGATPMTQDGVVVGAVVTFTDITKRKEAEAKLRHTNFLSDRALDLTKAGYWHVPLDNSGWYNSSERAARIFGDVPNPEYRYRVDEWAAHVLEGDEAAGKGTLANFSAAIAGTVPAYDSVYAYKRPVDGRIVWIHALGNVVKDANGKPTDMYGVTQDVTDVKLAEFAARESEQRVRETEKFFRSVLELAPDGMMVVDANGTISLANAQIEKMFGYSRDELIGQPVEILVPLDVRARHPAMRQAFHASHLSRGLGTNREFRAQRKDGSVFPIDIGLSPLPARNGEGAQVAVSVRDITERKQQHNELVAAKASAEEATQAKSMFLANMSHEIRTPMNAIIGLSHLALKTPLNAKQRDYVSKVHNAGTALLGIINDILDFSKIEAGKLAIETTDFRLDDVIDSVTTLTAQKAHEKGLEFLAHVSPQIPEYLLGDPLRLGQILTNFVNNAVKFTERGEIRLEIELLEKTGEKVQLKFSVRDTGLGMTPEQSAKLFQPFSQADASTTRKHGGTGLGLTICRRLVELMSGRVWLDSEAGVGSTFYFTVWLGVGATKGATKIVPAKLAQLHVLIVDDNPTAREILREPLSAFAKSVQECSSGEEAVAAIKAQDATDTPFDVVLMDWRMPGLDGLQASRSIKSDDTIRHQPAIVLVTAFGREEVRAEAENLNLDGFLLKPVTKSMLVDTLMNIFAEEGDGALHADAGTPATPAVLQGARILLTEDNEINQQVATELLQSVGAAITIANNGREAVELLTRVPAPPFDVVLMDLQMPEMDGYQATARLRAEAHLAALPIIAMTAHATLEERNRCLAIGMNEHISKPIDPALLYSTVARFYRPAPGTTAAAAPRSTATGELPKVAGLNTEDGLARVAGNRKLYLKLLSQFAEQQGAVATEIAAALPKDRLLAERLAHTTKGVAGNIGALTVQTNAGALEKLIREQAPQAKIDAALVALEAELAPLVKQLRVIGAQAPARPPAPTAVVDAAEAKRTIEAMATLLKNFDPAAGDYFEGNRAIFQALLSPGDLATFEGQLQVFALTDALTMLQGIAVPGSTGA